jgi:hypothetical protein
MCHYAQLTFPVPAVIVVILFKPDVAVDPVNPAPMVIVPAKVGYFKTTIPEPPVLPVLGEAEVTEPQPPPPVFAATSL